MSTRTPEKRHPEHMSPSAPKPTAGVATTLYRLLDNTNELLYVGIAGNPGRRFEQHKADKPWWGEVTHIDLIHFGTREEALIAEREAIQTEHPRYNHTHVPRMAIQAVTLWCGVCDKAITGDSGYLTISYNDIQAHADTIRAANKSDSVIAGFVDLNILLAGPGAAKWRAYHRACDPRPTSTDYWISDEEFATWRDILETTAHLLGKTWLEHTNWDDVLYGVLTGRGPIRMVT